jgi:hypothetical protein
VGDAGGRSGTKNAGAAGDHIDRTPIAAGCTPARMSRSVTVTSRHERQAILANPDRRIRR